MLTTYIYIFLLNATSSVSFISPFKNKQTNKQFLSEHHNNVSTANIRAAREEPAGKPLARRSEAEIATLRGRHFISPGVKKPTWSGAPV